jgi:hypothetical protein
MMGTAVAVSDGSLKEYAHDKAFGTAAFVLEGMDSHNRILGTNIVPGPIKMGMSMRAELSGLIGVVYFINALCKQRGITSGAITVACDNEASLWVFDPDFFPNPQKSDTDLVKVLLKGVQESPVHWIPNHVKGHQDKHKKTGFTRLELLNMEMDEMAKAYWRHLREDGHSMEPPVFRSHNEGWTLWHGQTKLTQPDSNSLYSLIQDPSTVAYWVRKKRIPEEAVDTVDWEASGTAMTSLPRARRRWVTKHASENCGTNATLAKWGYRDESKCPRCNEEVEDCLHVLQCTGEGASETWQESITKLEAKLLEIKTHPGLIAGLISRLNRWRSNRPTLNDHTWDRDVLATLQAQDRLGWKNMLECLPVKQWRVTQQRYFKRNHIDRSLRRWNNIFHQQLHELAHKQWEHRNKVLHETKLPLLKKHVEMLHREIEKELLRGPQDLPPEDCPKLRHSLESLLKKDTNFKQAWLQSVHQSRLRQCRRFHCPPDAVTLSPNRQAVLHWIETGLLR